MTGVTVSNCSEQVPKEWESKGRCLKSSNWSPRCVAVQVFLGLQTLRFMEPAACFEDMPRYAPICSLIPTSWTHNSSCLWVEKKLLLLRGPPPAANSERWSCSGWSYHVLSFLFSCGSRPTAVHIRHWPSGGVEWHWDLHGISIPTSDGVLEATRLRCRCPLRGGLCHWIWSLLPPIFFWNPDIFRLSLFVEHDLYFLMVLMVC